MSNAYSALGSLSNFKSFDSKVSLLPGLKIIHIQFYLTSNKVVSPEQQKTKQTWQKSMEKIPKNHPDPILVHLGNAISEGIQPTKIHYSVEYANVEFILPARSFLLTKYSFACNTKPENTNAEIVWLSSQN